MVTKASVAAARRGKARPRIKGGVLGYVLLALRDKDWSAKMKQDGKSEGLDCAKQRVAYQAFCLGWLRRRRCTKGAMFSSF